MTSREVALAIIQGSPDLVSTPLGYLKCLPKDASPDHLLGMAQGIRLALNVFGEHPTEETGHTDAIEFLRSVALIAARTYQVVAI